MGADCKSVGLRLHWFESSTCHQVQRLFSAPTTRSTHRELSRFVTTRAKLARRDGQRLGFAWRVSYTAVAASPPRAATWPASTPWNASPASPGWPRYHVIPAASAATSNGPAARTVDSFEPATWPPRSPSAPMPPPASQDTYVIVAIRIVCRRIAGRHLAHAGNDRAAPLAEP